MPLTRQTRLTSFLVGLAVTLPTCVIVTPAGVQGFALNAGPVVR